jgi:hypothetical protein
MEKGYVLYRKSSDSNLIAAILTSENIDDIVLHIFDNTSGSIEVVTHKNESMKLNTEGRALWSEITWEPSKKWVKFVPGNSLDIEKCVDAVNQKQEYSDLQILDTLFKNN